MFVCGTTTAGSRYNFRGLRWLELVYFRSLFSPSSGIQDALQHRSGFWIFQQALTTVRTVLNCDALAVEEKSVNHSNVLLAQKISELQILEVLGSLGFREVQWCACLVLIPVLEHPYLTGSALGMCNSGFTWNHLVRIICLFKYIMALTYKSCEI